ncbi:hypothetical protein [Cohnella candidum]|uniref:Endolytic transglycosylase MltG n=1 Tax=Cohnella candidum TaxID=2674991 RepID=A0A3G3JWX6_9BACL|nr:hypothetical protein [Cohnella candidum]AYQ72009.1 hypothetical protein EAV92_05155 [Cohnella candidum]
MRKHRKWLMGFGIGIIVGACMLQLIQFAKDQDQQMMVADGAKTYTQQQLDDEVAKALEEAKNKLPDPTPSSAAAVKPGNAAATNQTGEASPSASPAPSASASPAGSALSDGGGESVKALYITNGMSLRTVALSLQALGLIEDADDFTEAARSISRKMEVGTAEFKGKPTYKEIIAELTRKK